MQAESLLTSKGSILNGPLLFKPKIFEDSRGYFFESWNEQFWTTTLAQHGQEVNSFLQDNQSCSFRGVLRGLHYQVSPHPQAKLVRCLHGKIFDVVVDLRVNSSTFGAWASGVLSDENFKQFWVPAGFAHGVLVLSETAEVLYKTNDYWEIECERSIRWNDPSLAIDWPLAELEDELPNLSDKDAGAPFLSELRESDLFV